MSTAGNPAADVKRKSMRSSTAETSFRFGRTVVAMGILCVLAACTVVVDGTRPPQTVVRPPACTMEHAPVCATRNNRRQTFSNACLAAADGFRVISTGSCRPAASVRPPAPPRPVACTMEHAPVCATRNNRQRTFSNACLARAENFRVISNGACRPAASVRPPAPPRPVACTMEHAPVCATRNNRRRTFSNACLARAEQFRVVHRGTCR